MNNASKGELTVYAVYISLLIKSKHFNGNRWFLKVAIYNFIFYFQHSFNITLVPKGSDPKIH